MQYLCMSLLFTTTKLGSNIYLYHVDSIQKRCNEVHIFLMKYINDLCSFDELWGYLYNDNYTDQNKNVRYVMTLIDSRNLKKVV